MRKPDYYTTEHIVKGECVECGSERLEYDRQLGREYQLHFDCRDCGTTIKFSNDPVHYWEKLGEYKREVIEKVEEIEIHMDTLIENEKYSSIDRMEVEKRE